MRTWFLAAGVCLGLALEPGPFISLTAACGAVLLLRHRPGSLVALVLCGFVVGGVRAHQTGPTETIVSQLARAVATCSVEGSIDGRSGAMGTFVRVREVGCDGVVHPVNTMVVTEPTAFASGTRVSLTARFSPLLSGDFDRALRRMGAEARVDILGETETSPPTGIGAVAAEVRDGVRDATEVMPAREGALTRGLVIGDTDGFTAQQEASFRAAGLSHLVAVSGSNVAIVVGAILLVGAGLPRIIRYVLAAAGLAVYVVVVGPEPSVLRATAMGAIGIFAALTGRQSESWAALGLAAAAVVSFRPDLMHSVGLHLSVAATAGIVLWAGPIADRIPGPQVVTLPLGVTLAAQVAVAPIIGLTFGVVSIAALPANLLAAPAVAPATVLGLASGTMSLASVKAGRAVAWLATPSVAWIDGVAETFGARSWAEVAIGPLASLLLGGLCLIAVFMSVRARLSEGSR